MDKIFVEGRFLDKDVLNSDGHTSIPPAFYEDNEEWVEQYREQFGTDPSFF